MLLDEIVMNSNYVTDEELADTNIVGAANTAIAEVNGKCGTELPFFTEENRAVTRYNAISATWCLRLIEPYFAYTIAANDTDSDMRDFHYNRFLQAVNEFNENGLGSILKEDPETGEPTGYEGSAADMVKVDASDFSFRWWGLN